MAARAVRITENFLANLESIERFLRERDASGRLADLGDLLFDVIVPNLERFPAIGVDLLARGATSIEARSRIEALRRRLGSGVTLREYATGDYLVLYAVRPPATFLLAIKHHRQLSYDLRGHWAR